MIIPIILGAWCAASVLTAATLCLLIRRSP